MTFMAVSHTCEPLAKMTIATRCILAFARDHSGPFSTSGLAAALGLSRRTVERAHAFLKRHGIATVYQRMTSKGRHSTWQYDLDALPPDALSHPDTGVPIPGGPKGVSGWLAPVGGRCQKGGLKSLAPRVRRGFAGALLAAKERRRRPKGDGRPKSVCPAVASHGPTMASSSTEVDNGKGTLSLDARDPRTVSGRAPGPNEEPAYWIVEPTIREVWDRFVGAVEERGFRIMDIYRWQMKCVLASLLEHDHGTDRIRAALLHTALMAKAPYKHTVVQTFTARYLHGDLDRHEIDYCAGRPA